MLGQRISTFFQERDWFAVWLEIFVVFLGVFIGLQANNWNEARIARATANTHYARLIEDFHAEERTRLARIAYLQRTKLHGEAALRTLEQPESAPGAEFLIDIYQTTQIWYFNVNRTTYDELLSGNIANAIPDFGLRTRLANFYLGLETGTTLQRETTPLRNNLRRYMPHAVQSAVREACGDQIEFLADHILLMSLPEKCEVELDSQAISDAIVALRSYVDLKADLTRHLADLEAKLWSLSAPLPQLRETRDYLEEIIR